MPRCFSLGRMFFTFNSACWSFVSFILEAAPKSSLKAQSKYCPGRTVDVCWGIGHQGILWGKDWSASRAAKQTCTTWSTGMHVKNDDIRWNHEFVIVCAMSLMFLMKSFEFHTRDKLRPTRCWPLLRFSLRVPGCHHFMARLPGIDEMREIVVTVVVSTWECFELGEDSIQQNFPCSRKIRPAEMWLLYVFGTTACVQVFNPVSSVKNSTCASMA